MGAAQGLETVRASAKECRVRPVQAGPWKKGDDRAAADAAAAALSRAWKKIGWSRPRLGNPGMGGNRRKKTIQARGCIASLLRGSRRTVALVMTKARRDEAL